MLLASNRVMLRSANARDYEAIHRMELDPGLGDRWRYGGRTPSPAQFVRSFWGDTLIQAAIVRRRDNETIGLATCYDADLRNGHGYVSVLSRVDAIRSGGALEGFAILVSHLFTDWPFQRLFAESFTGNAMQFEGALGRACEVEARLVDDRTTRAGYEDRLILGFDRETWMDEYGKRVLGRLQPVVFG